MKGSHIIKGKKIDVKKALSKEEMARVNARNNSNSTDNWGGDNRSAWEPTMRNFGMSGRGGGWRGIHCSLIFNLILLLNYISFQVGMILIHGSQALVPGEEIGEVHQLVLGIIILVMVINKILVLGLLEEAVVLCEEVELQDQDHTLVIIYIIIYKNKI